MRDAVAMATAAQPSVGCFVTPGDLWQHRAGPHASVAASATGADASDATDAEAWRLEHFGPSNPELSSLLFVRLVAAPTASRACTPTG